MMQTFLISPNFRESAQALDNSRLGNQRREVKCLYTSIVTQSGWFHHPVAQMWVPYVDALLHYGMTCCDVWRDRDKNDSTWLIFMSWLKGPYHDKQEDLILPPWLGSPKLHASHRSNLLRKVPDYYSKFGWTEGPNLPYFWPAHNYDWQKYESI
jgi:hypothetical protein